MGQSYPCWGLKDKLSKVVWMQPTTYYSLVLLSCAGLSLLIAIALLSVAYCLRRRADL